MSAAPRKGQRIHFVRADSEPVDVNQDLVTGLRFSITAQHGGGLIINYTELRPRRLALAVARAVRHLSVPGGSLTTVSSIESFAIKLPKFFAYLSETDKAVTGAGKLRARHIDGFESWLAAKGLAPTTVYGTLQGAIMALRQIETDEAGALSADCCERLRYISAKPVPHSTPRDAYSPFVARQIRDAAREDIRGAIQRLQEPAPTRPDNDFTRRETAIHNIIKERGPGLISYEEPAMRKLCGARRRAGIHSKRVMDEFNGRYHFVGDDIVPLLIFIALETGLEYECCKALTINCLQNPHNGTVEIAYVKHRARHAAHKHLRVRDGNALTPGGLIRRVIELTAAARRHHPTDSLWVYHQNGVFVSGIRDPVAVINRWTLRHGIVDDDGRPLQLVPCNLRKTHKALWYLKTEGHMARFAVGHTAEVAARHYADIQALRPLHEATVAEAFTAAVSAATAPIVLTPEQELVPPDEPRRVADPLDKEQDVWLASCGGFYASPYGKSGEPCPKPFWGCLECSNAVITARKLPAILAFLTFIETERSGLTASDWQVKFGRAHDRIMRQVLPAFSEAVISQARADLAADPQQLYLPPEAHL